MERSPAPALLPILRSQQQAEVLAWLLEDPTREASLAELSERLHVPPASIHREVERAEQAGLVVSRRIGRTRLIRVNRDSPFVEPLRELLGRAFGAPVRLANALRNIPGIDSAFIFGSWAARFSGLRGTRPVGDIDLLVLGSPDREQVYAAVSAVEHQLSYPVQLTIREADWLTFGTGSFHDTVTGRPMVQILGGVGNARKSAAAETASVAH